MLSRLTDRDAPPGVFSRCSSRVPAAWPAASRRAPSWRAPTTGRDDALERALVADLLDRAGAHQPRASTSIRPSASPARPRPAVAGQLAAAQPAATRSSRSAAAHRRDLDDALELIDRAIVVAGRRRRPRDGAHDARRWLALPQPRPAPRAAAFVATTLDAARLARPQPTALLEWLLELSDSLVTYRARYVRHAGVAGRCVDLLVFDATQSALGRRSSSRRSPSTCGAARRDRRSTRWRTSTRWLLRRAGVDDRPRATCAEARAGDEMLPELSPRRGARPLRRSPAAGTSATPTTAARAAADGDELTRASRHALSSTTSTHVRRTSRRARLDVQHVACLTPRALPRQHLPRHASCSTPVAGDRRERIDCFGNARDQFTILTPYSELRVTSSHSVVEVVAAPTTRDRRLGRGPRLATTSGSDDGARRSRQFRYESPYVEPAPELAAFARARSPPAGRSSRPPSR